MQPSSGLKSTEFVLTVLGLVVGVGLILLGVFKGQDTLVQYGLGLVGANTVGYTVGRSAVKAAYHFGGGDAEQPTPATPKP